MSSAKADLTDNRTSEQEQGMRQTLSLQNMIGMGFMSFAMFLGAGNLIFPPMVGQLAGVNMWQAGLGFLITGVGLPLLGVVVIARVGGGFNEITRELPRKLVVLMGSCIFLIIGPLYAVPRTAMVSYEVGFAHFLDESSFLPRLIFSTVFFIISWYFAMYPGKLLESVGKLITPALIILLIVLGIAPVIMPLGAPGEAINHYHQMPLLSGFLEGYMTMDAMAALMFGVVIATNLKSHGITSQSSLFRYSIYTGLIAAAGLSLVYISLLYLGATSRDIVPNALNGSQILTAYVDQLFGFTGSVLLAAVVTLACLTTSIGCITAAGEYFDELTDKLNYNVIVALISLCCIAFANLGLNQIIQLFVPVLLILYPICIALIFLGLIRGALPNPTLVYRSTLSVTLFLSIIDALASLYYPPLQPLLNHFKTLPGFDVHLSWVAPALMILVITFFIGFLRPQGVQEDQA